MIGRVLAIALFACAGLTMITCGIEEDRGDVLGFGAAGSTAQRVVDHGGVLPTTSAYIYTGENELPSDPGVYAVSREYMEEWLPEYSWDTAQLLVHENGHKEIIWDRDAALRAVDTETGLPFCENFPEVPESERRDSTPEDRKSEPTCTDMAMDWSLGPASERGPKPSDP